MLLKRTFLFTLLCCSSVDVGGEFNTLGDAGIEDELYLLIVDDVSCLKVVGRGGGTFFLCDEDETTLGDAASSGGVFIGVVESIGNVSIRFSCFDNSNNAFLTGSPAVKVGIVEEGGCVKIVDMSEAACFK